MNNPLPSIRISNPRIGSFADLLVRYVRERCHGYSSVAYNAAWINRRTWSAIVSHPQRAVAKRTAVQFAFALRLSRAEADELLLAAGYAFSPALADDQVFAACIENGIYDLFDVNKQLFDNGLRPIPNA